MPNSFAESQNSVLLIADGFGDMLRWDGRTSFTEPAGIVAPASAPTMAAGGAGEIVGDYTAYVRYLDRYGNVSNVSPASTVLSIEGTTGQITEATNAVPIVITSAGHGMTTGSTVKIVGVEGNSLANGTWRITVIDADTFSLDDSAGNSTYRGAGVWYRGVSAITYSSVETPSDPSVVARQILRNTDGQLRTFYVDIETTDLTSSSFSSTKTDDDLIDSEPVPFFDDDETDLAISRYSQPPSDRKVVANMLGRMFAVGDVRYLQGAVAVVFGSSTVTGIGTEWTSSLEGRFLTIDGAPKQYAVESVNVAAQTAELAEPYLGPTDPYTPYVIQVAASRRRAIDYSESFLPEAWPPTNSLDIEADSQADDLTGLMRHGSFLYPLQRSRMRRLTFQNDPSPVTGDGGLYLAADRGCINHRSFWVDDTGARLLDTKGIHAFYGNDDQSISDDIKDLFTSTGDGRFKVNWMYAENFHAVYDPSTQILRWFVTLDGSRYPRHAIALDIAEERYWIEEYYRPIASSCLGKLRGQNQAYLGTNAAQVLALGAGPLDGPNPSDGTTRGYPTSVGLTWLADSSASFGTDLVNAPLHIVEGPGRGQWRTIVSVSGGTLKLDRPWSQKPTTTSVYQIGGISWSWKSGTFRWASKDRSAPRRVTAISRTTESASKFSIRLFLDRSATPMNFGASVGSASGEGVKTEKGSPYADVDMTAGGGFHHVRIDAPAPRFAARARFVEVELSGVKGAEPVTIFELAIDGGEQ